MKTRELVNLGMPKGQTITMAKQAIGEYAKNLKEKVNKEELLQIIRDIVKNPEDFIKNKYFGSLAQSVIKTSQEYVKYEDRKEPAPYKQWGTDIEEEAIQQMENACKLPISVRGALMPDAHLGYGLPIGGVLATDNAIIPYAVGMDIACRMKMTVLDMPVGALTGQFDKLKNAITRETSFGVGAHFKKRHNHKVLDEDWNVSPITKQFKDKAWSQLGSSGSSNHFVEFGILTVEHNDISLEHDKYSDIGLEYGKYIALLSHGGSRGTGYEVATHYSKLAHQIHPELPHELSDLSWLDMDSEEGVEYWNAMELMGRYAAANHEIIHQYIAKNLGVDVLLDIENHHNFAWKEKYDGREVIVHRKGATPAGKGDIGIIPGSMATPAYVVFGKGNELSLNSASHGAGRKMSRKAAKKQFTWSEANKFLAEKGVKLLSAGLDEIPMAYKDIDVVMADQSDLVEIKAKFDPKIVKMAEGGEKKW